MLRPDRFMKKVGITELRKKLSRYLAQVNRGESILVFNRNQPVAQFTPLPKASRGVTSAAARLARLERQGLIRRGNGESVPRLVKHPPMKGSGSARPEPPGRRR